MALPSDHPAYRFEELVRAILAANDYSHLAIPADDDFDIEFCHEGKMWKAEVKYYRTARAQLKLIETAAAKIQELLLTKPDTKGMLIVSSSMPTSTREALEKKYGLDIVDREGLAKMVPHAPNLLESLSELLETDFKRELDSDRTVENAVTQLTASTLPPSRGEELSTRLRNLLPGKQSWQSYESLCDDILRYLFEPDLLGWHKQWRTDDGLNRFDYICRINTTTEFWTFLAHNLNSRYIIFEFKNYTDKISQGQILTTEKYLFEKALRRVGIVFCRAGADDNAIKMAQGAMREHGKMILIINDELVHAMLKAKDSGSDPSDILFDTTDFFLQSLPR